MIRNRKWMMPVIALLLCVSMVGVGYAAWVITAPTTVDATSNFTAYPVESNVVPFTTATSGNVVFGKPQNATTKGKWLTAGSDVEDESLNQTLTLTVAAADVTKLKGKNIEFKLSGLTVSDNVDTAVSSNYIVLPTTVNKTYTLTATSDSWTCAELTSAGGSVTKDGSGNLVVVIPMTFTWGSAFGSQNPYTYYNALTATSANVADAATKLGKLNEYMENATYTLTVTSQVVVSGN